MIRVANAPCSWGVLEFVHFKDCDRALLDRARAEAWDYHAAIGRGIFCEPGRGTVRFREVLDALAMHHYSGGIVVEQDVLPGLGTPAESAQRNREDLRALGI